MGSVATGMKLVTDRGKKELVKRPISNCGTAASRAMMRGKKALRASKGIGAGGKAAFCKAGCLNAICRGGTGIEWLSHRAKL